MERKTVITIVLICVLIIGIIGVSGFWLLNKTSKNGDKSNSISQNSQNSPPSEAIAACSNKKIDDTCEFQTKDGTLSGVCNDKPGVLACAPNRNGTSQNQQNYNQNTDKNNNTKSSQPKNDSAKNNIQGPDTSSSYYGSYTNSSAYQGGYNIEQAVSDKAQLNTLAFGGLGFLTGNICSDSFLPPGKVADFFGFQYLRDITADGNGHNTDFVTNSANNILYILNDQQKAKMIALAKSQAEAVNQFAYDRYPLMESFRRQLTGDIPSGKTQLSKSAVMSYSGMIYELDANISLQRAELYADIINSLNSTQKVYVDKMVTGGFSGWTALPMSESLKGLERDQSVLVMTYASEMFGWYGGDVNSDTYFCPERQADYFGGFYLKDAPAIGNAGYTISESKTGDAGEAFVAMLDNVQQPLITNLVDQQRTDINGIVEKRKAISTELRKFRSSQTVDESLVRSLAREYGSLDGEISYYYVTAFSKVKTTLSATQKAKMLELTSIGNYTCPDTNIYLYSEKITKPTIQNTDFLFE